MEITLSNDVEEVDRLSQFVEDICATLHFDMTATTGVNLAVEEAVVNVMSYAYPEGAKGKIRVAATVSNDRLIFVIRDTGQPFDPTLTEDPDITQGLEERNIGGLGIFLIRHYMDDVRYERLNGENILTLTKNLTTASLEPDSLSQQEPHHLTNDYDHHYQRPRQ